MPSTTNFRCGAKEAKRKTPQNTNESKTDQKSSEVEKPKQPPHSTAENSHANMRGRLNVLAKLFSSDRTETEYRAQHSSVTAFSRPGRLPGS